MRKEEKKTIKQKAMQQCHPEQQCASFSADASKAFQSSGRRSAFN